MKNKRGFKSGTILAICGPTFAILFLVYFVLITSFLITQKKEVKYDLNTKLTNDALEYEDSISNLYDKIVAVNNLIGKSITNTTMEKVDYEYCANLLSSTIDEIYLVAIVNNSGEGLCSGITGNINLSSFSYYEMTNVPKVLFVENDGLLGRKAMVFITPLSNDNEQTGLMYTYVEVKELEKLLPVKEYDRETYFALVDNEGDIVFDEGQSVLGEDSNIFDTLENVQCEDVSAQKVSDRIRNGLKQSVNISSGEEHRTLITVPIQVCEWTYVEAINKSYLEDYIFDEMKESYKLARGLFAALLVSLVVIIIMLAYNKLKVEEQSRFLENKADTDLLSGVNNKLATERKIQEYIDNNPNSQSLFVLLDIDNFKKINDTKGHAFGDLVIKSLGEQLSKEFRSSDIIGRIGGDEFVVFLKNLNTDELLEKESKRLLKFFEDFSVGDYVKYSPTASLGGAIFSKDGTDFKTLYKEADAALYAAKKNGKNQFVFYTKDLSNSGRESGT